VPEPPNAAVASKLPAASIISELGFEPSAQLAWLQPTVSSRRYL
jgi:hypothetical protein